MKNYKLFFVYALTAIAIGLSSCKKDDGGPAAKIIKNVTEDIVNQTVWYPDTLYVISNKAINVKAKLTIRPGTIIKLEEGGLNFTDGYLIAVGTETEPIVFTSIYDDTYGGDTDGDGGIIAPKMMNWDQIIINTTPVDFQMKYCKVLYGTSIFIKNGFWGEIDHCTFAHMGFPLAQLMASINPDQMYQLVIAGCAALTVQTAVQSFNVRNCTFYDNTMSLAVSQFMNVDSTNHFSENGTGNFMNGVFIIPPLNSDALDMFKFNITLDEDEVPYVFIVDYTIKEGASLNFSKDAIVKCYKNALISIESGGNLNLNSHNVIFTSIKDDEHGGDTNGDGDDTTPQDGDWRGIYSADLFTKWWGGTNILYDDIHLIIN